MIFKVLPSVPRMVLFLILTPYSAIVGMVSATNVEISTLASPLSERFVLHNLVFHAYNVDLGAKPTQGGAWVEFGSSLIPPA